MLKSFSTILLTLALLSPVNIYSAPSDPLEHQVKSAFVYRLIRYIEWKNPSLEPITIGVIGDGPIKPYLQKIEGKLINNKKIIVKTSPHFKNFESIQILFVTRAKKDSLKEILKSIQGKNILTISDIEGFCNKGGNIGLVTVNGKVRLQVNLKTSRQAGLKISSKILRFADITSE